MHVSSFNSGCNRQEQIPLRNHLQLLGSHLGFKTLIWTIDWMRMFAAFLSCASGCGWTRSMVWTRTKSTSKGWCLAVSQSDFGSINPRRRSALQTADCLLEHHAMFTCSSSMFWYIQSDKAAALSKKYCDLSTDYVFACWPPNSAN